MSAAVHLLPADDWVMSLSRWGPHVALCGERVAAEDAPSEGDDAQYCPACVREAACWSAESGTAR